MADQNGIVETVIKKRAVRGKWTAQQRREIVGASLVAGASISEVAERYGIRANLLTAWRRRHIALVAASKPKKIPARFAAVRVNGAPVDGTVFQTALGWTNSHLHEFVIGGVRYADPDPDFADELEHVDQKNVVLVKALGVDSRCFDYVYDFGDDWHHIVIVEEQIPDRDVAPSLVHCSGGANRCPPEDVGSTRGYAEFLEAIADPEHEEHDRYLHWVGGHFDATRFDIDATNLALSKIKI